MMGMDVVGVELLDLLFRADVGVVGMRDGGCRFFVFLFRVIQGGEGITIGRL
jgi:hypothetical protein